MLLPTCHSHRKSTAHGSSEESFAPQIYCARKLRRVILTANLLRAEAEKMACQNSYPMRNHSTAGSTKSYYRDAAICTESAHRARAQGIADMASGLFVPVDVAIAAVIPHLH